FEVDAEGEAAAPEPAGAEVAGAVRRVEVRGTKRTEADVIELVIKTKPGDALDRRKVTEDVKRIYKTGFYDQVRARLEPEGTGAAVVFEVTERLLISRVEVEGPDDSEKSEIRALMTLKPNTFLNPYEVEKNLREIRKYYANKGYFSADVEAETEEIEDRRAEVIVKIEEGEEQRIQRIRFTGNTAFTDDELRDEIQSGEDWLFGWLTGAGDYKEDLLKADVYFLTNWYLNHGYFKVKVEDADVAADKEGLYLTYAIIEGDPYNVKSVAIQGVEDEGEKKLIEDSLQLKAGDLFTRDALQKDIENITTYYSDIGFARAQVDPDFDIDDDAKLLGFTYKIEKGPKVYFDRIRITGNDKTRDKVIRRELLFEEQQQYSGSALKNTKERLEALGYFSEVNINTAQVEGRPDREAVEVNIREGETGTLSGGAGFSSTDSFLFNVRITNRNLFGRGQSVGFSADIGGKRQDFTLQFTEPYLFDIPLTAGVQLFRTLRVFQDFDREAVGGSFSVSYPVYERIRLGTAWRTELVQVTNVDDDATFFIRSQEGERLTNSMTWSLSRNTYNHPIDPTRGSNTRLSVELAGTVFGGDTDFVKVIGETRWFFPVVYGTTFSFAGRFGWA
ncbi:MAG: outer membrane protein assembly factor BamA, partial [Candidatus Methylomirabilis sp.]|nr:outer membrane protein assembly factor BamA [Deltaproteobacteria bacterium]